MTTNIPARLDEIERLDPDPLVDAGVLDLMEDFAREAGGTEGLRELVERYGGSASVNIVAALAILLARSAAAPTPETRELVFSFLEKLRRNDYPEVLISCLTAVYLYLSSGGLWRPIQSPPRILYPFLMHSLNYSQRHALLVRHAALQVLGVLHEKALLERVFDPQQLASIRLRLGELSASKDDLLESELVWLGEFLDGE
jgi:hypothetical protein